MLPKVKCCGSADVLKELLVAWIDYADLLMQLVLQTDMMRLQICPSVDKLTQSPVHILRHDIGQLIQFVDSHSSNTLCTVAVILFVLGYALSAGIGQRRV